MTSLCTKQTLAGFCRTGKWSNIYFLPLFFNFTTLCILDSDQPLIRPSFSVCKYPFYKNPAKYQEFLQRNLQNDFDNETEFNALVDEVFYNKPEDFFHGFNIAPTYEDVVNNSVKIPLADPYVR